MAGPDGRVATIVRHLARADKTANPSPSLLEIELGDTAAAWRAAGFTVTAGQLPATPPCVHLCGLKIVLNEQGGGVRRIVLGSQHTSLKWFHGVRVEALPIQEYLHCSDSPPPHPNSCSRLGEVVLYAHHLTQFVDLMSACGVSLPKPPKLMGDDHCIARYMLCCGTSSQQLRLLVAGAKEPPASAMSANPNIWMLPNQGHTMQLTGWLPLVRDLHQLRNVVPQIGSVKTAVQKGRQIATLKSRAIAGLTGTFAFLSDTGEPLFG